MSFDTVPPPAHSSISVEAARALVESQAPEYAHLPLGQHYEGWDCAMYRLGGVLAVRLPRTADAVRFLLAETRWVPELSAGWSFPFPHFPFVGVPGAGFPFPWAIVSWLPGDMAVDVPLLASEGPTLGLALAEVHQVAPLEAPINVEQSIPMTARSEKVLRRVAVLGERGGPNGERLDTDAALALWATASGIPDPDRSEFVWSHADLHGANVLSMDGRFAGIVDWGSMAACDPAVDVGFAYSLMPGEGVASLMAAYGEATGRVDDAFVARARGIGLAKAVGIAMNAKPETLAMGWRALDALGLCLPART
ncbi:phosphotransferase [Demequina sp.]|uniref:phosphotransferase n=1 Tax=Demequina sp. TaxID=2050685 RepID=UPI003D0A7AD7